MFFVVDGAGLSWWHSVGMHPATNNMIVRINRSLDREERVVVILVPLFEVRHDVVKERGDALKLWETYHR